MANSLTTLGSIHRQEEQYQLAINFYQQSLISQLKIGDRNGTALSYYGLSLIYQQQGQSRSYRHQAYRIWQELQLPLAVLPCSDFQKQLFFYTGEDSIDKQIQIELRLAWFYDLVGLIIFIIRWLFSPIRWIQKRLRSKR